MSTPTSPTGAPGTTTFTRPAVVKIAGLAAREVPGVHELGGGGTQAVGALTGGRAGAGPSTGVSVEVGERQAAVDLTMVVEYGVGIGAVAEAVRRNVITMVEAMTGFEVVEVNVDIVDMHLPSEPDEEPATAGSAGR